MVDGASAILVEGREDLEVVGESHYQENLWRLVGGPGRPQATREPTQFDTSAAVIDATGQLPKNGCT